MSDEQDDDVQADYITREESDRREAERAAILSGTEALSDRITEQVKALRLSINQFAAATAKNAETLGWSPIAIQAWKGSLDVFTRMLDEL